MRTFPRLPASRGGVAILLATAAVLLLAASTVHALDGWNRGYRLQVVNPGPALDDY